MNATEDFFDSINLDYKNNFMFGFEFLFSSHPLKGTDIFKSLTKIFEKNCFQLFSKIKSFPQCWVCHQSLFHSVINLLIGTNKKS